MMPELMGLRSNPQGIEMKCLATYIRMKCVSIRLKGATAGLKAGEGVEKWKGAIHHSSHRAEHEG